MAFLGDLLIANLATFCAPNLVDLCAIGCVQFAGGGVVVLHRLHPRAFFLSKAGQEFSGIARIADRVEGFVKRIEGIRMISEVHLHAADINITHAAAL